MIITLCGSARFETEFKLWNESLTLQGHVVFSLAVYPSDKPGGKDWYTDAQKKALDVAHLNKIAASDAILVLDVNDYVGDSTKREIAFARAIGKDVYSLSWNGDKRLCPFAYCRIDRNFSMPPCAVCYE